MIYRTHGFQKVFLAAVTLIVLGVAASAVSADQVFAVSGNISGTGPVSATATFHQSGSNLLQISLQNLQATSNVGQSVSGIQFQICDSTGNVLNITGSITTQNNSMFTVDANGVVTDLGVLQSGWGLSSNGPSFSLTALGFTGQGTDPADEAILGTLSNPNGSITGNGAHNPFIDQTGVFSLTLSSNLPVGFQIRNVVVLFGTGPDSVLAAPVPEPATMFLFGAGLVGLASRLRKRKARKALK